MKTTIVLLMATIIFSCGLNKTPKNISINTADTIKSNDDSKTTNTNPEYLLDYSQYVLNTIKNRDIVKLASYVHPDEGVRLSPYGYIDLKNDRKLPADELIDRYNYDNIYLWGYFDGTGYGIKMTLKEYFNRFIYDVDFENESTVALNECMVGGNSQNNIQQVYNGLDFVEYYYAGTKKMENMDWKVLRLVYKKLNDTYYLVGIVHDEWTI